MLKKMVCIFTSTVLALLLGLNMTACVSSPSGESGNPAWVSNKDAAYPADKYLAEVGEGDTLAKAKVNAASAIVQIFSTTISVDSTIRTRYSEITGSDGGLLDMTSQTDVDEIIGQRAEESLSNLKYGESWTNDMGKVYVIAYLERAETGNLYRQRIIKNDERVEELRSRANAQSDPLRKYAFMDAALVFAEINADLLRQLEIINMPMGRSIVHPYVLGDLQAEKADQAADLKIQIEVSGDETNTLKPVLEGWVAGKGFSLSSDGDMFFTAVIKIEPVELNNEYENLNWELNLNLMDSAGVSAISIPMKNRASGISETAARSRVFQDMTKAVQKTFDKEFTAYLSSFLEK